MAGPSIDDVCKTKIDPAGNQVLYIYARKGSEYLVYRDPSRVMLMFADDEDLARDQRASMAQLYALRGQISGLIDGWHESPKPDEASRASRYDRRVADAMITGFEGRIPDSLALLAEIRDDIIADRKSIAQTDYLIVAAIAGVLFLATMMILVALGSVDGQPGHSGLIWSGGVGGVLGAFFSIAIGLRSRSILIDLQRWDNRRDAILRMAVGTIAGGVFLSLLLTNMATVSHIDRAALTGTAKDGIEPVLLAFILGFIGGFSERAVPGLLSRASLSVEDKNDVAATQARAAESATATPGGNKVTKSDRAADATKSDTASTVRNGKGGRNNLKSRMARTMRDSRTTVGEYRPVGTADAGTEATAETPNPKKKPTDGI